jgi:hypothetical protein
MKLGVAGVVSLLVACTAPVEDDGATASRSSAADATPLLSFGADWSVTASAPVTSGGKATIHYDLSRMPKCRTWYRGFPAWDIVAFYAVDGGTARSVALTKLEGTTRTAVDPTIDVGPGKRLSIWFHASDESGCSQWDSAYEANYNFPLAVGDAALRFESNWTTTTIGTPRAGQPLLISFDTTRLWQCRSTYNGMQAWDIVAHYRFDGGAEQFASLTATENGTRISLPAKLTPPAGARHIELWFENHDRTGCRAWDSHYGANYTFAL